MGLIIDVRAIGWVTLELNTGLMSPAARIQVSGVLNSAALIDVADVLGGVDQSTIPLPVSELDVWGVSHFILNRTPEGSVWLTAVKHDGTVAQPIEAIELTLDEQRELLGVLQDSFEIGLDYEVPVCE